MCSFLDLVLVGQGLEVLRLSSSMGTGRSKELWPSCNEDLTHWTKVFISSSLSFLLLTDSSLTSLASSSESLSASKMFWAILSTSSFFLLASSASLLHSMTDLDRSGPPGELQITELWSSSRRRGRWAVYLRVTARRLFFSWCLCLKKSVTPRARQQLLYWIQRRLREHHNGNKMCFSFKLGERLAPEGKRRQLVEWRLDTCHHPCYDMQSWFRQDVGCQVSAHIKPQPYQHHFEKKVFWNFNLIANDLTWLSPDPVSVCLVLFCPDDVKKGVNLDRDEVISFFLWNDKK